MKTLDTRDLYTRKCELEALRDAVTAAQEALDEAEEALASFDPDSSKVPPEDRAQHHKRHQALRNNAVDAKEEWESAQYDFGTDEQEELAELEELESVISDFRHGETIVHERSFEDYARELAEELHGSKITDAEWPFTCINWSEAANELRHDYTEVEYQGDTYLVRA